MNREHRRATSGAALVAGTIYKDITLAGHKLRISQPKLVGIFADIEAFIISRKTDPMVVAIRACKTAPASMHRMIMDAAIEQASKATLVTEEEWGEFSRSLWAPAFFLWKSLDPKHLDEFPTVESIMDLINAEAAEGGKSALAELMANVDIVQQERELKNSAGRSATPAPGRKTANHSAMAGRPSTNTSLTDSDGTLIL